MPSGTLGAHPSVLGVTDWIIEDFLDVRLEAYGYFYAGLSGIEDAACAILVSGIFEDFLVATIMLGLCRIHLGGLS